MQTKQLRAQIRAARLNGYRVRSGNLWSSKTYVVQSPKGTRIETTPALAGRLIEHMMAVGA